MAKYFRYNDIEPFIVNLYSSLNIVDYQFLYKIFGIICQILYIKNEFDHIGKHNISSVYLVDLTFNLFTPICFSIILIYFKLLQLALFLL